MRYKILSCGISFPFVLPTRNCREQMHQHHQQCCSSLTGRKVRFPGAYFNSPGWVCVGQVIGQATGWQEMSMWDVRLAGDVEDHRKFVTWQIPDIELCAHLLSVSVILQPLVITQRAVTRMVSSALSVQAQTALWQCISVSSVMLAVTMTVSVSVHFPAPPRFVRIATQNLTCTGLGGHNILLGRQTSKQTKKHTQKKISTSFCFLFFFLTHQLTTFRRG